MLYFRYLLGTMSVSWKIECTDGKKDAVCMGLGKTVIGRGHLLQVTSVHTQ